MKSDEPGPPEKRPVRRSFARVTGPMATPREHEARFATPQKSQQLEGCQLRSVKK